MALNVLSNNQPVSQYVQEIFLETYVLPEFQRTFVWSNDKVKKLWESLYDKYPIGQLMFWGDGTETEDFPVRALGLKQKEIKGGIRVIVDGQQRLTAIWLVLTGDIKLYFNLESKKFTYDSRGENTLKLDIMNNRSYDEVLKMNFFFAHASSIQGQTFATELHNLNSMISNTYIPFQVVTHVDYNTVVNIFRRLNELGVPLNESQIALASVSITWKGVFRRTFDLMKIINTELNYEKNEDPDLVVRAWTCVHTGQHMIKHLAPESKESKYCQLATVEQYEKSWAKLENGFSKTIELMKQRFDLSNYQFIRGYNSIIVLTNYFANHEIIDYQELDLSKWFIQSLIVGRYSERATTRFREDIKATNAKSKLPRGRATGHF